MQKIQLQDLDTKQAPAGTGESVMFPHKNQMSKPGEVKIQLSDLKAKQAPAKTGEDVLIIFQYAK